MDETFEHCRLKEGQTIELNGLSEHREQDRSVWKGCYGDRNMTT